MIPISITNIHTAETLSFTEEEVRSFSIFDGDVNLDIETTSKEKHPNIWRWFADHEEVRLAISSDQFIGYLLRFSGGTVDSDSIGGPPRYRLDMMIRCYPAKGKES